MSNLGEIQEMIRGQGGTAGSWPAHLPVFRRRIGELAWVIGGKLTMVGANAAMLLLLARHLELKLYGLFVTSIGGQLLLSRLLMLGVDRGVIRLRTLPDLRHRSLDLYGAGLAVIRRMSALAILAAIAALLALSFSTMVRWPAWMIALIVAGAIGTALVDYLCGIYQSQLQYRKAAVWQSAAALGRLISAALAVLLWPHQPLAVFLAYFCTSLILGLLQLASAPRGEDRGLIGRLLRYSMWPGMTNFIVLLYLYQGTFLLSWMDQDAAAGIFGLAVALSTGFHAVYIAYAEYLLPRVSRVADLKEFPSFLARSFGGALALGLCGIPVALVIGTMVAGILSPELAGVTPVFYYFSASMLLLVCQCPLEATCHYLLRPQLMTFGWALRVVCAIGLALTLGPIHGAWGMAVAQLGGMAAATLVFALCVAVALRNARSAEGV